MKYAIIKSGIVDNIIEWDGISKYEVDGLLIEADSNAYIGGVYADGAFMARVPTAEEIALEEAAEAEAEAKAQLRTSVINKIATNLTSEEKLWLEENL